MPGLERITVQGFKSIREMSLEPRPLNVLIGANGSGKSNFVGVFRLLNELVDEHLQLYVGRSGGPDIFLHFGQKHTERLSIRLEFRQPSGDLTYSYDCTLVPAAGNGFVFQNEYASFHDRSQFSKPYLIDLGAGHTESQLARNIDRSAVVHYVRQALQSWRIYHFHDTSDTAKVKQIGLLDDNRFFRPDASNLAAYLYWLQQAQPGHYRNIVGAVRMVAPFFGDFDLRPSPLNLDRIRLEWSEQARTCTSTPPRYPMAPCVSWAWRRCSCSPPSSYRQLFCWMSRN